MWANPMLDDHTSLHVSSQSAGYSTEWPQMTFEKWCSTISAWSIIRILSLFVAYNIRIHRLSMVDDFFQVRVSAEWSSIKYSKLNPIEWQFEDLIVRYSINILPSTL